MQKFFFRPGSEGSPRSQFRNAIFGEDRTSIRLSAIWWTVARGGSGYPSDCAEFLLRCAHWFWLWRLSLHSGFCAGVQLCAVSLTSSIFRFYTIFAIRKVKKNNFIFTYFFIVPPMLYYSTPVESYLSEQVRPAPLHLLLSKYIDYMRPVFL